jgi:hypothetical protein
VSKTPLAALDEFEHYLGLAEAQLAAHDTILEGESTTHTYQAMFGHWQLPFDRLHAIVLAGFKVNPRDLGGFEELSTASVPRFGGSPEQFDAVVREAARLADGYDAMAVYASLYDSNSGMFEGDIFSTSNVDWPTMRKGFDDYLKRYPQGYPLNRFALQACAAQDKPTTLALLDRIGPKPSTRAWGTRLESCRRWARSP